MRMLIVLSAALIALSGCDKPNPKPSLTDEVHQQGQVLLSDVDTLQAAMINMETLKATDQRAYAKCRGTIDAAIRQLDFVEEHVHNAKERSSATEAELNRVHAECTPSSN